MITTSNYYTLINTVDLSSLPDALKKGHELVQKVTNSGENWSTYHASEAIKKTIDIYLSKLNEFINSTAKSERKPSKKDQRLTKPGKQSRLQPGQLSPEMVERIPEELRFIRRFINLNGKSKNKEEILRFINSLQKAIIEKRIRKTSPYAAQIKSIQCKLVEVHNTMKAKITIQLKPETFEKLKQLTIKEKVLPSVNFIKAYINLNGKTGTKKKADQLLKRITRMVDKHIIPASDPYMDELIAITKNLEAFLYNPTSKTLAIEKNELNGLEGILGCACQPVNGSGLMPAVMNSMDFANMQFETIGLQGKWFDLIGDPSSNFTAMVFGKPKMGKSYLCIEFAGYLARHHSKVLYVAKEEGLDMTLQKKLNDTNVKHPNLDVASLLPENLSKYDFIFLDSVNRLGLSPEDLNRLKFANPAKSFIFIFQTTKEGKFKGANAFQHDVDVVIEVPERGKATQMGRFNQGGEMDIF